MALLLGVASSSAHATERVVDRIAAVVDGVVISLSDVYDRGSRFIETQCAQTTDVEVCRSGVEREILDSVVLLELERQELVRVGRDVTERDIDAAIEQTLQQYGFPDRDTLRVEVEKSGFSWADYRQQQVVDPLRRQIFAQTVLRSRISIGEDELRDQYQRLIRDLEPEAIVTLSVFGYVLPPDDVASLPDTLATVREAMDAVRAGTRTWEEVVAEFDTAGLAEVFGDRPVPAADLRENLRAVVEPTLAGQIADPVIADGVIYGVKVLTREAVVADAISFEEARPQLENAVFSRKISSAEEEWYALQKRRVSIEWFLGTPPPGLQDPTVGPDDDDAN